ASTELRSWLTEESKPLAARVDFAIRVWQSVEFPYPGKHEIIIRWLGESLPREEEPLPMQQLKNLFGLRSQPGLVGQECKSRLIRSLLAIVSRDSAANVSALELLLSLLDCELLQDALRADYEMLCDCYACVFRCHQRCVEQEEQLATSPSHAEFIVPVIKQLAEIARRSQKLPELRDCYNARTVRPLVELLCTLKPASLVEELAELEKQLKVTFDQERIASQPLHVNLMLLEAAVFNSRYENLGVILRAVFPKENPSLPLAACLLMSLQKHEISLQFNVRKKQRIAKEESKEIVEESQEETKDAKALSAFDFIAQQLLQLARQHRKKHLKDLLVLLCSALRLNPLLLEESVYQITVWLLTAPKETAEEERLYSEYLVLLLDMFRRLSRAERFIMNLLKSLKEWLAVYQLPNPIHGEAKKRRLQDPADYSAVKGEDGKEQHYLRIIFTGSSSNVAITSSSSNDAFKQLNQTWPSHSAGVAFTRLVSHLMTKPSLVIWRTLLHSFAELLQEEQQQTLPGNLDFARELHAALLCQYLSGCRLAEQLQLHQTEVEQQLQHTAQVLEQFGRRLLSQEHNRRLMNAFLECTERASGLELLLAHYWPDGHAPRGQQKLQLRGFLPPAEWTLIQQRVHNFGKSSCRQRLQRLELQLAESGWLLQEDQRQASCPDALAETLGPQQLFRLNRSQKQLRLRIRSDDDWLKDHLVDAECVELLTLQLLGDYCKTAKKAAKGSLLAKLRLAKEEEVEVEPLNVAALIVIIKEKAEKRQLQLPCARQLVDNLQRLPLAQLPGAIRSRLWLVIFALYRDLSCSSDQEQEEVVQLVLAQLIDMMHFGQPLPICSYFGQLSDLLEVIPTTTAAGWNFYESLFARCIRRQSAGYEPFLASCTEHLRRELAANGKLQAEHCRLLLLAIETLASVTGVQGSKMQRQLQPLLGIYGEMVSHKFRSSKKRKDASAYKEFVDATLAGYATYVSSCINRLARQERENKQQQEDNNKEKEKENEKKLTKEEDPPASKRNKKAKEQDKQQPGMTTIQPIDDNFRRICKIYIGHSLNYRSSHAIRLLNVALTHRQRLHLDPDEIEFVLSSYWRQLNADIEAGGDISCLECLEPAIRLIIGYKTNEDFLLLLRRLTSQVEQMPRPETPAQHTGLRNVLTLLALFAKCSLSSVKAAMLNEHFELISVSVALRLPEPTDAAYRGHALRLLEAQRNLAGNRTVPLTGETLDCLLGAMLDVDIKHLRGRSTWQDFVELYGAITENLLVLLKQHGNLMADRAAQLSALCQDLVQGIVGYRAERKQAQDLSETELDGLAELGLKLATVMATVAGTQALAVKRVAPFLLIFTIRQMVATERPTTLFEKVKVHIVRVCHELIGICDHRAGHFILRSSSEAGARLYEGLMKEHDKYHKFRGKV
ncbi:hypothetical protein KR032_006704, partial [Drosophila birchii]